ncbi:Pro-apoptotic serine protease NMA111 [Hondaea fermentalgiana]|uniref:Pro-apoptotic serine protease NMA111 n=1 Tax=Hondaea fermentalgiana TaxID=2315210 RepID=A0A2R5GCZ7_9STRA|nr:Pro-apoptotic serine protease NMA111 [Hondaea fermentalgiana]|eukprot:GBG28846.1 Pro-apoptotic serine protease NMA111 [Hondaea fermentalgiana]
MKKLFCGPQASSAAASTKVNADEAPALNGAMASSSASATPRGSLRKSLARMSSAVSVSSNMITNPNFEETVNRAILGVVVLNMTYTRPYEGGQRGSGGATGFVVDKKRGIILTNRHVVTGAPMRAFATFQSKEEVELEPIYSDPIHDFGFFRFDPSKVQYQELIEIPLAPERAKVGTDIRVCGNDNGEKLAILSGTLARLDRNAPRYGGPYSDHNTFYLSAASNTSGGSSGSPVLDRDGYAVGLNAGGAFFAASSFYLPLERVVRSFEYIKRGELPPRRTVQTIMVHKSFVEVERLGLPDTEQATFRKKFPKSSGLLTVDEVIPESQAESLGIKPGDILVKMNGKRIWDFVSFEDMIDSSDSVTLSMRRGVEDIEFTLDTESLHDMMPTQLLELSNGAVHTLSYMQAVSSHRPVGGVVINTPGYMFNRSGIPGNIVLKAVGDQPTPDIQSFALAMSKLNDLDKVSLTFTGVMDKHRKQVKPFTVDRRWFPWVRRERVFENGQWEWQERPWLFDGDDSEEAEAVAAAKKADSDKTRKVQILDDEDPRLCAVSFESPIPIMEIEANSFIGCGVIIDASEGLVVCDRNTVPSTLGNVSVTIGGTVELPAQVLLVHPMHNLALIKYDASKVEVDLGESEAAQMGLGLDAPAPSPIELKSGMKTRFVGFSGQLQQVAQKATVTVVKHMQSGTASMDAMGDFLMMFGSGASSSGAKNQIVIELDNNMDNIGGVLLDDDGLVQAFWFDFWGWKTGVPASIIYDAVNRFREGEPLRTLAAELGTLHLSKAASAMGLSDEWVAEFSASSKNRHVLSVSTVLIGSNSEKVLQPGDIILAIDDKPMIDYRAVEQATADKDEVKVTVLRDLAEEVLTVPTTVLPYSGTDRVILWAGAIMQQAPLDLAFRGFLPEGSEGKGVLCSGLYGGSPAHQYHLRSHVFINAINESETPDLDAFAEVVSGLPDGEFVRVHTTTLEGIQDVSTVKLDDLYWELRQLRYDEDSNDWEYV